MKCNVARLQNVESQLRAAGDGNYMAEVCACPYIGVNRPTFASFPAFLWERSAFFALFSCKNSLKIAIIFRAMKTFCVQQLWRSDNGSDSSDQIVNTNIIVKVPRRPIWQKCLFRLCACASVYVFLIRVRKDGSSRNVLNVRGRSAKMGGMWCPAF